MGRLLTVVSERYTMENYFLQQYAKQEKEKVASLLAPFVSKESRARMELAARIAKRKEKLNKPKRKRPSKADKVHSM